MTSAVPEVDDLRDSMVPVILGGDIGAYSLARTFHEAYGVKSVVVSSVATGVVRNSRIIRNVVEPGVDDAAVIVPRLIHLAKGLSGKKLILCGSADWLVRIIVENRVALEPYYAIPYTTVELLDQVTQKAEFSRLCGELGLAHPTTVVYDVAVGGPLDTSALSFPVIAKTGDTAAYHQVEFEDKKKVFEVGSHDDLVVLLDQVAASGYRSTFIIQDFIPGDDSGMRILTCYSDRSGKVRWGAYGQVLLEEHTPGALGNPAGIVTEPNAEAVAQATKLLEHIGWTGYANFDLKFDPRDGRVVFFELNPRLGRSNFYITAAGRNTAVPYVREYLQGLDPEPEGVEGDVTQEHLYTVLPLPLLLRYVLDPSLRRRARRMIPRRVTNPLWYRAERDPRRLAYLVVAQLNQWRKYAQHYPLGAAREQRDRGLAGQTSSTAP